MSSSFLVGRKRQSVLVCVQRVTCHPQVPDLREILKGEQKKPSVFQDGALFIPLKAVHQTLGKVLQILFRFLHFYVFIEHVYYMHHRILLVSLLESTSA